MFCKCPVCGAGPAVRVTDRVCRCDWTELQGKAVERLTNERDEARERVAEIERENWVIYENTKGRIEKAESERNEALSLLREVRRYPVRLTEPSMLIAIDAALEGRDG